MSTRETQKLILDAAISLFNEYGSANVSTNRIAEHCGISKGNLNYHFRVKSEIVIAIFSRISEEMKIEWYGEISKPTLDQLEHMFLRQLNTIWRFRFFYRELVSLLREDDLLRRRFQEQRQRRQDEVLQFMNSLISYGLLYEPENREELDHLITATWVLSDHWLNYVEAMGRPVDEAAFRWGYEILFSMIRPHFTPLGRAETSLPATRSLNSEVSASPGPHGLRQSAR